MMTKIKRLIDAYKFLDFCPDDGIQGIFGDSHAVVIRLHRRKKRRHAESVNYNSSPSTIVKLVVSEICHLVTKEYTWRWRFAGSTATGAEE